MKRNSTGQIFLALSILLLLSACGAKQTPPPTPFQPLQLTPANYTKKVDTFVIVHDASSSMSEDYAGTAPRLIRSEKSFST